MRPKTAELWAKHNQHQGDRWRLFAAIAAALNVRSVFYPGCYVDIAPSFVFDSVTYLDVDKRTPKFFDDTDGLAEIVVDHNGPANPNIAFIHGDYTSTLDLCDEQFDLLISLYAHSTSRCRGIVQRPRLVRGSANLAAGNHVPGRSTSFRENHHSEGDER